MKDEKMIDRSSLLPNMEYEPFFIIHTSTFILFTVYYPRGAAIK